jgi:hypothetical protein
MNAVLPLPRLPSPKVILVVLGVCEGYDEPVVSLQALPGFPGRVAEGVVKLLRGRFIDDRPDVAFGHPRVKVAEVVLLSGAWLAHSSRLFLSWKIGKHDEQEEKQTTHDPRPVLQHVPAR